MASAKGYRARDTKLDGDVAIKILAATLAVAPERVARFEQETKTLASHNHPNVGAIYGLEEANGVKALVLGPVEGVTLADRIAQGLSGWMNPGQLPDRSRTRSKPHTWLGSFIATETYHGRREGEGKMRRCRSLDKVIIAGTGGIIRRSFDFYTSIIEQHRRVRRMFGDLKGKLIPYDQRYKGLLEPLFDDDLLCGFRVYWPNGGYSEFSRTRQGCSGMNITFEKDLSIGLMVGLYASKPGSFSPLVEHGASPVYTPAPGRTKPPSWPDPLQIVDAEG